MLVTGASRGIGAAIARRAALDGMPVAIIYERDAEGAQDVTAEIIRGGGRALALRCDVSVQRDVEGAFQHAERELGPLAGLVNNAGITGGLKRVEDIDAATLERVFAINVTGAFLCAREAILRMSIARGGSGGAIVNVSSVAARLGGAGDWVHYAASKGALETFTIGLAREVASQGVRVNAVAPGLIETGLHAAAGDPERPERMRPGIPMQRVGTPEEVAEAVCWLLSPAASYITGAIVDVAGGR